MTRWLRQQVKELLVHWPLLLCLAGIGVGLMILLLAPVDFGIAALGGVILLLSLIWGGIYSLVVLLHLTGMR